MKNKIFIFTYLIAIMNFAFAQIDSNNIKEELTSVFPYAHIQPYNIQGDTISPIIIYDSAISKNIRGVVGVYFKFGEMSDTIVNNIHIGDEIFRNIGNIQVDSIKILSIVIIQEDDNRILLSYRDSGQEKKMFNYYERKIYPYIVRNIRYSQMDIYDSESFNNIYICWTFPFYIIRYKSS